MPVLAYPVQKSFYHFQSVSSQVRLARNIRKRKIDIVHTYGWYPNVFGIPPAWFARRPALIASIRDAGAYMTPAKIRALRITCALADCIIANSEAGRAWLMTQGVRENKIEVIRNGVNISSYTASRDGAGIRREFDLPANTPLCACIGRVVSGKGIDFYLRAARILADQNRNVRFLMVGAVSVEKNYKSEMEMLARDLNLNGRVIFTGQRQDVADILREVDIVVHPSLTEGLSNVILEAMSAGLPVVATRVGGSPELVQDGQTGLLIPPKDEVALSRAIAFLLDDPQTARRFGQAGRERIIREFSISRLLNQTEELYLRLSGTGGTIRRPAWR
jgi:glycosyltransferase involved in cell wall biosynthesis